MSTATATTSTTGGGGPTRRQRRRRTTTPTASASPPTPPATPAAPAATPTTTPSTPTTPASSAQHSNSRWSIKAWMAWTSDTAHGLIDKAASCDADGDGSLYDCAVGYLMVVLAFVALSAERAVEYVTALFTTSTSIARDTVVEPLRSSVAAAAKHGRSTVDNATSTATARAKDTVDAVVSTATAAKESVVSSATAAKESVVSSATVVADAVQERVQAATDATVAGANQTKEIVEQTVELTAQRAKESLERGAVAAKVAVDTTVSAAKGSVEAVSARAGDVADRAASHARRWEDSAWVAASDAVVAAESSPGLQSALAALHSLITAAAGYLSPLTSFVSSLVSHATSYLVHALSALGSIAGTFGLVAERSTPPSAVSSSSTAAAASSSSTATPAPKHTARVRSASDSEGDDSDSTVDTSGFAFSSTMSFVPRFHLIELHEQEWVPEFVRVYAQRLLCLFWTMFGLVDAIVPVVDRCLVATGDTRIVDLCAGGGGPSPALVERLNAKPNRKVSVVLTDLFPETEGWAHLSANSSAVSFERQPVDATSVPARLHGFRTLFASAHHFQPPLLRGIIRDAVSSGEGIGIFELTERSVVSFLYYGILGWFSGVVTPFVRPLSWTMLFFTYVIPICPFVIAFDGAVSCLRTYTDDELRAMIDSIPGSEDFTWEFGREWSWFSARPVSYVTGVPTRPKVRSSQR